MDLGRPGFSNMPHDGHPSGRAHRVYAKRLAAQVAGRRQN